MRFGARIPSVAHPTLYHPDRVLLEDFADAYLQYQTQPCQVTLRAVYHVIARYNAQPPPYLRLYTDGIWYDYYPAPVYVDPDTVIVPAEHGFEDMLRTLNEQAPGKKVSTVKFRSAIEEILPLIVDATEPGTGIPAEVVCDQTVVEPVLVATEAVPLERETRVVSEEPIPVDIPVEVSEDVTTDVPDTLREPHQTEAVVDSKGKPVTPVDLQVAQAEDEPSIGVPIVPFGILSTSTVNTTHGMLPREPSVANCLRKIVDAYHDGYYAGQRFTEGLQRFGRATFQTTMQELTQSATAFEMTKFKTA